MGEHMANAQRKHKKPGINSQEWRATQNKIANSYVIEIAI
jgi:hypothetical protein